MKFKYIVNIACNNFTREKKKNIINIILMVISLTIFISTTSLSASMKNYFQRSFQNNVECRTLFVNFDSEIYTSEQIINKLYKYKNISAAIPQSSIRNFGVSEELIGVFKLPKLGGNDGTIKVNGGNYNATPDVMAGRKFEDGESNVAIIPNKFIPDSRLSFSEPISNNKGIEGKDLLGKEIQCKFEDDIIYTFTVVGVYDFEIVDQARNTIYIPYSDMDNITSDKYKLTSETKEPVVAVVDEYNNVEKVINELYADGMSSYTMISFDQLIPTFVDIVGLVISIIVFIVAIITISTNTMKVVRDREPEIGMLKAIGYKNSLILKILNIETLLVGVLGFIISIILSGGILYFINNMLLSEVPTSSINISLDIIKVITAIAIAILVPVISTILASIRTMKITPALAMKE